ncbi:S8 family serine peptidase [Ferrimonas sp.]|uniref:S8 family serine peptidase n=1 Tax=Ferrimonas sp. TaxID=2080861 RepID=UPI003A930E7D
MKTRIAIAVGALLASGSALATDFRDQGISLEAPVENFYAPAQRNYNQDQQPRFLVKLNDAPIATYSGGVAGFVATDAIRDKRNKLNLSSPKVQDYASYLKQKRQGFAQQAAGIGAKVERQFDTLFNGVSVSGQGLTKEKLLAMPGVAAVYDHAIYTTQMDASRALIHAPEAWELMGGVSEAGKGIKVAIIDSGIRPEHPMFSGANFDELEWDRPEDDYCATTEDFCNNKLIVARYSTPTFDVAPDEHMSPLGYGGHGTHVAGTAVGNVISASYSGVDTEISGVAPGAYLMVYKALFAPADDIHGGSGSNIMLLEALEMAVKDGADVINNSWGGGAGSNPAFSPYVDAFEAAEAAGILVSTSAGNSGSQGAQSIGCPSCIESGLSVANFTHGRFFAKPVSIGSVSDAVSVESTGEARLADLDGDLTAPAKAALFVDADNVEGCAPFDADAFKGAIAVISRGSCAFSDKASNAADAGAIGMVVYNNRAGQPITMSMDDGTIPSVMIDQADGTAVVAAIEGAGDSAINLTVGQATQALVNSDYADIQSGTSSRGPNGDSSILKPDLAAPGTDILSAWSVDDPGSDGATFAAISGTSMASPHVAGAAALMKQAHPDWSAVDIKTALTSSTKDSGLRKDDAVTAADAFDAGAGRLEVANAIQAEITFSKPSLVDAACVKECEFEFHLYDKRDAGSDEKTYYLSGALSGADIDFDVDAITLAGGGSAKIGFTVDGSLAGQGDWLFGQVRINDDQAHLPLVIQNMDATGSNIAVTADGTTSDKSVSIDTHFENADFSEDQLVTITAKLPQGTSMVEDSAKLAGNRAATTSYNVNEDHGTITWAGNLGKPQVLINKIDASLGYSPSAAGRPAACSGSCDESAFNLDLSVADLKFKYLGQEYDYVTVSTNGIVLVGGGNTSGTWLNRQLPDANQPNNILAPFWTDLDLKGSDTDTAGGGNVYWSIVGASGPDWLVVEWAEAKVYGDSSDNSYTFQVWISLTEDEGVFYQYLKVDSLPAALTIGAENSNASAGVNLHFNGTGTPPAADDLYNVSGLAGGNIDFSFELMLDETGAAADDSIAVTEDAAMEFTVTDNDSDSATKLVELTAAAGGIEQMAVRQFSVESTGDLTPAIKSEPANGTLTLADDGTFTYTPNKDFNGSDSFSYTLIDGDLPAGEAQVMLNVAAVNDAPVVAETTELSGAARTNLYLELSSISSDVDGDSLSWSVEQTGGDAVSFSTNGGRVQFTLPADGAGKQATFSVMASDGELESNKGEVVVTMTKAQGGDSDSSSFGFLALALSGLALLRRRKLA